MYLSDMRDQALSRLLVQCNQLVYVEGYEACMEGKSRFSCEYECDHHARIWLDGYTSAMTERGQLR